MFVAGNTVPLPPDNHPDNGILEKWSPVFTIPASSDYYLIKITGKISHDWNESCPVSQCPNALDGATLGSLEGGAGRVDLGYASPEVNVAGGASPTRYYAGQHPDGNGTAYVLARASYARTVWARRSGLGTGCLQSGGSCDPKNRQPQYFLSGQQSVTLHRIPVPLSVTGPAAVATGQPGAFTSAIVENLPVDVDANGSKRIFWYFREGDTLATPGGGISRNVPCTAYTTCSYSPAKSGRMHVTAYVQGFALEGYSEIVRIKQPELVLTCNGQSGSIELVRTTDIDCRAVADPAHPQFEIIGWTFSGGGFTIPDVPAGDSPHTDENWSGPMVVSGKITVTAKIRGVEQPPASVNVVVTPREEFRNRRVPMSPRAGTVTDLPLAQRPPSKPDSPADLGKAAAPTTIHGWSPVGDPQNAARDVGFVTGGPNQGLVYLKEVPLDVDAFYFVHPELAVGSDFYAHQATAAGSTSACVQSQFAHYIQLVISHEGADLNPMSHLGYFERALNPAAAWAVEHLVGSSLDVAALSRQWRAALEAVIAQADAKQLSLHGDTGGLVSFGCNFNFTY